MKHPDRLEEAHQQPLKEGRKGKGWDTIQGSLRPPTRKRGHVSLQYIVDSAKAFWDF